MQALASDVEQATCTQGAVHATVPRRRGAASSRDILNCSGCQADLAPRRHFGLFYTLQYLSNKPCAETTLSTSLHHRKPRHGVTGEVNDMHVAYRMLVAGFQWLIALQNPIYLSCAANVSQPMRRLPHGAPLRVQSALERTVDGRTQVDARREDRCQKFPVTALRHGTPSRNNSNSSTI